ncbi:major facilitator superfamily domain-containing protein [Elsinoe ampelina]|uniref:Major facilitator superfamily domain-containing protein n=1 Tax=Elsinoe ampelina TaxID=302913 RepID=A0A6A6G099_9PEZI|nr:major facilitator superfamily domain-containing protein [Elsinoe ampelina]
MRAQVARASSSNSRAGQYNTVAARGGIDADLLHEADEDQPLLNNKKDGSGGDDEDEPPVDEFAGLPWYKRPSIYWVLVPFSILAISYGGIITPRVNLIINLLCREYLDEQKTAIPGFIAAPVVFDGANPQCQVAEVEKRSAQFTLYGNLIAGLLSAITAPKLGALSDRYGRCKMIAITSLGSLSGDVITIMAASNPETFSVNWILLGFALDGICGSFTTAFAIVHAYATDCTTPAFRSVAFAMFHGCLFTGIAAGPILAGLITRSTGTPLTVFYIMLGVHIFFLLFMGFIAPESLSKGRQQIARDKHESLNSARQTSNDWIDQLRSINLVAPLKVMWPTGPGSTPELRRNLILLAAVDTLMFGVAMGSMTVILIYVRFQFNWQTYESGVFMSIVNTARVLSLFVILPTITRLVRGKPNPHAMSRKHHGSDYFDLMVIRTAVFFDTVGYLGYTLARQGSVMIFSGVVASLGGMGSPTLQSALTKHVPPEKTGQLLGALGLLHALARVVAPTIFQTIFIATVESFRQTVFVCLTATFGLAFIFAWFVKPNGELGDAKID